MTAMMLAVLLGASGTPERLLVLDLTSTGISADTAKNLSEIFAASIREAAAGKTVLGQSEISSMLALERQRDLLGCASDVSCLAEIGGALGAGLLAVGSVGRVGSVFVINVKLLDTNAAA